MFHWNVNTYSWMTSITLKRQCCFQKLLVEMSDDYESANYRLYHHVLQERHRLGGDFVVAWAFADEKQKRIAIRKILGLDMIYVVLRIDPTLADKRKKARDQKNDHQLVKLFNLVRSSLRQLIRPTEFVYWECEPAAEDEPNAINIEITDEMTPEDIANKIYGSI